MNLIGFQLSRAARFFGFASQRRRHACMLRETQFLNEAVDLLGRSAWQDAGEIEDLAAEFWQIKNAEREQRELRQRVAAIEEEVATLDGQRAQIEAGASKELDVLHQRKSAKLEESAISRQKIVERKEELDKVKRRYAGMRFKLQATTGPGAAEPASEQGAADIEDAMSSLRAQFSTLEGEIAKTEADLGVLDAEVSAINSDIDARKEKLKLELTDVVTKIGRNSKTLAEISAKTGALQNSKSVLANRIGRYLSQNIDSKAADVRSVLRKHRTLSSKILHYRRSIGYQQRLVRG